MTTTGNESLYLAGYLYAQTGVIESASGSTLQTKLDASGGQSGRPIYYYPGGCCGAHYLTGLVNKGVHSIFGSWTGGPKARSIRSWVILNK